MYRVKSFLNDAKVSDDDWSRIFKRKPKQKVRPKPMSESQAERIQWAIQRGGIR